MNEKLHPTVLACAANGKRLLDEAELLEFEGPAATQYFLSVIAQEELAKAFLLYLVTIGAIPFSPRILRAARDHSCKQLIGIVMEFLTPDTEKFLERINAAVLEGKSLDFPAKVADAINILRYEKIGRWESDTWCWAEEPGWDSEALKVAEGKLDRRKQDSLYVKIGKDGSLAGTPKTVNDEDAKMEYDRGRRFEGLINDLVKLEKPAGTDWRRVEEAFKVVFSESDSTKESAC